VAARRQRFLRRQVTVQNFGKHDRIGKCRVGEIDTILGEPTTRCGAKNRCQCIGLRAFEERASPEGKAVPIMRNLAGSVHARRCVPVRMRLLAIGLIEPIDELPRHADAVLFDPL
jgi:hypothetical protein